MSNFYMKGKVWDKIQNYSKYAYDEHKSEIGGMLLAEKDKEDKWHLHSPVILEQEISGGNTHLFKEALAAYYVKTAMKYKDRKLKFVWWHSHHTMDVFWSGTDLEAIEEMNQGDWSVSLVVNLQNEYKLRVNIWKPFPAVVDDLEMDIIRKKPEMPKSIINEVEKLCTKQSLVTTTKSNAYYNTYYGRDANGQGNLWKYNYSNTGYDRLQIRYEAKVEDIILEAMNNNIDYDEYTKKIKEINNDLIDENANFRVGIPKEANFDNVIQYLETEDFFHKTYVKWDCTDLLIEKDADMSELAHWNNSFEDKLGGN